MRGKLNARSPCSWQQQPRSPLPWRGRLPQRRVAAGQQRWGEAPCLGCYPPRATCRRPGLHALPVLPSWARGKPPHFQPLYLQPILARRLLTTPQIPAGLCAASREGRALHFWPPRNGQPGRGGAKPVPLGWWLDPAQRGSVVAALPACSSWAGRRCLMSGCRLLCRHASGRCG